MTQVAAKTHEANPILYYAPVNDDGPTDYEGLDPYWALSDLLINECNGYVESEVEIDGEIWDVQLNYSKSGFVPRASDPIDADRLLEFDLKAYGRDQRKVTCNFSPRHADLRDSDGERVSLPFDHTDPDEGVAAKIQSSNVHLDALPGLLPRFLFELADEGGVGLYHGYFDEPFDGWVRSIERYVRFRRGLQDKLIGTGGVFDRLAMLLSGASNTVGERKWDNEGTVGKLHRLKHGSTSATMLCDQHDIGGQIKCYLPENPEQFEPDDPLYHPKVATKMVKKWHDRGSVRWGDRHDLLRELDERLLSVLSWAEIPTEAGGTTFVADDHFDAAAADDSVPIHADPTPRLEADQEHLLLRTLGELTASDRDIAEVVATDGGMPTHDLADEAGVSLSTLYRALQRMDGILESDNGHVRFVSEKLRQELRAVVEAVEDGIESAADRAAQLLDYDVRQSASSAFDRWLAKYGAEFEAPEHEGDRPVVRIDTVLSEFKSSANPRVSEVLDEMLTAWQRDGRDIEDLLDAFVDVQVGHDRRRTPVRTLR